MESQKNGVILETRGVTKNFGGLTAVNNVTIRVQESSVVGLIGPNGSGKSTLFNLITNELHPTQGDILFREKSILGLRPSKITHLGIARTYQNTRIFKTLTVFENVRVVAREHQIPVSSVYEVIERLNLGAYRDTLAEAMSYGNQKMLEVAMALVINPKLIMLDEPVAGVDDFTIKRFEELLLSLKNKTLLVVEHNMEFAMNLCQHIIVLDQGQVIAEGTPEEIRQNPRVVEAYLGRE